MSCTRKQKLQSDNCCPSDQHNLHGDGCYFCPCSLHSTPDKNDCYFEWCTGIEEEQESGNDISFFSRIISIFKKLPESLKKRYKK